MVQTVNLKSALKVCYYMTHFLMAHLEQVRTRKNSLGELRLMSGLSKIKIKQLRLEEANYD